MGEDDGVGARQADAASSADLVAANADRLAEVEVRDNGKLMAEMLGQLRYHPEWWRYFGGLADKIEGAVVPIDKPDMFAFTPHEPVGVVAALTAWNSPLLFIAWKCAAGARRRLHRRRQAVGIRLRLTLEFAALTKEAGFPDGVFNVVTGFGPGDRAPRWSIIPASRRSPSPARMRPARKIYAQAATQPEAGFAGARRQVAQHRVRGLRSGRRRCRRDLGHLRRHRPDLHRGLAPAGAELDPGQFSRASAGARPHRAQVGDPMLPDTNIGPVTTPPQYTKILDYIDIAKAEGARCLLGGGPASGADMPGGQFVEPTIFTDVEPDMRIAREEVFGPVLSIIGFEDEAEAIQHRQRHHLRPCRRDLDQGHRPRRADVVGAARPEPCGSTPTAPSAT